MFLVDLSLLVNCFVHDLKTAIYGCMASVAFGVRPYHSHNTILSYIFYVFGLTER